MRRWWITTFALLAASGLLAGTSGHPMSVFVSSDGHLGILAFRCCVNSTRLMKDELPTWVTWMGLVLTLAIHMALAAVMAGQTSSWLRRLPEDARRIEPKWCWLLLIPGLNVIWIWVVLILVTKSFPPDAAGKYRNLPLAITIAASYTVTFFVIDLNWAWVIALGFFVRYRMRIGEEDVLIADPRPKAGCNRAN